MVVNGEKEQTRSLFQVETKTKRNKTGTRQQNKLQIKMIKYWIVFESLSATYIFTHYLLLHHGYI